MSKPRLIAYTVRTDKGKSYWTRIGAAFASTSEKGGFTVLLDACPAPTEGQYKIVVLPEQENEAAPPAGNAA